MSEITLVSQAMPGEIKVPHLGGGPSRGIDCHFEVKESIRLQNILQIEDDCKESFCIFGTPLFDSKLKKDYFLPNAIWACVSTLNSLHQKKTI